jgi:membrane-associated phospholipid phosphatase
MRRFRLQMLCAGAVLLLNVTVRADDSPPPPQPDNLSYPNILLDDVKHVLTAPARWQEHDWQNFGLAAAGVVGVAAILDGPVRDEMRRHAPNDNHFLKVVERFGAEYSLGVLGGFYLAGATGNETAANVAQDGLSASIIASGIITPTIKFMTGRARPRENAGIAASHPFDLSYSSNSSFPSGHTTQAFAVASVIANHYEESWVVYSSYTIASLVGVARIYHDAHFTSDVVAGALIGTLVGKSVVYHNKSLRSAKVVLLPEIAPGLIGVRITSNF